MELGAVAQESAVQSMLMKMDQRMDELSAMVKGGDNRSKGGGDGKGWSNYKGPWTGPGSSAKGKDGKGKGKGAPSALAVAHRRAQDGGNKAQVVCPTQQRRGHCDFEQRTGRPCRFMHVKNLPPTLAAVDGLISSDLRGFNLTYDCEDNTYVCGECATAPKNGTEAPALASVIENEVAKTAAELSEEWEFTVYDNSSTSGGRAPGFPGHSH